MFASSSIGTYSFEKWKVEKISSFDKGEEINLKTSTKYSYKKYLF
jgi:hypothetical protein